MNKKLLLKLKEMGREFNVLYVEDEQDIRDMMGSILERLFQNVYIAKNGEEGLALFKTLPIDMVLTDIEMPIMSGLDMTQKIREISYDVPIAIISAFNDTDKFTRAIKNGVNRYLLKPIEQERVLGTLHDMLLELRNKKEVKQYHAKLQNEKVEKAVEKTAQYFLQSIPSPVFVLNSNKKIVYLNEHLQEMFKQKNINVEIGEGIEKIESLFLPDKEETVVIENNQRIIFKNGHERLFFVPRKQELDIPTIEGTGSIVVLNDVTTQMKQIRMIEYQKHKLQSNKEILEEFLKRNIFVVSKEKKEEVEKVLKKSEFNENEALLRRTHVYKTSALDYISTLSETIEDDLEELRELELDFQSELYEFEYSQKHETLLSIANILQHYANSLVRLIEFSDLGAGVEAVSLYLKELTQENIDSNSYMITVVLQSVLNDLSNWHEHVFITQSTDDIHYLDSSLYNTIIELRNSFEKSSSQEDEDELEFF